MDWIDVAQDRDRWWAAVNTVIINLSQNAGNFLIRCGPVSFSVRILLHGVSWLVG
jgi:hypothetical protein